ncbi:carboxypeptidase-like regulatory domain-containing protein [Tenacibaculum jejuense]|uniref:Outer membrane protein n=1 Tax=Tenacibaculum jejuense TaxID=584609 RepID=A0A238UCU8_9FLAO|nr:carboxypeptidase-like regulatory domain-containing protein [Tenacibaculum jejuense]SNR16912.1 conserved protein of unknown function [Tenacibaculum jejuense]
MKTTKTVTTIISILFAYIGISSVYAQKTITAEIIDAETFEPISFATVKLMGTQRGVIANYNGQFGLPLDKIKNITSIEISSIGYQTTSFNINTFSLKKINIIKLFPSKETLTTVVIKGKRKKKLSAIKLVRRAIKAIKKNLSDTPHSYIGYYRDYQINNEREYCNLNEGIVEEFDSGILSHKITATKNQSLLYSYKTNLNFKTDSTLITPYNDSSKYIRDAKLLSFGGNELSILKSHNPIRLFNHNSFSFVNEMQNDFIRNHNFKKDKKISTDDDVIQTIIFNKKNSIGNNYTVDGKLKISVLDYSIYSFEYTVYELNSTDPILHIDIEYKKIHDKMYLNYMSFHNKFLFTDNDFFKEKSISYNKDSKALYIEFNRKIDTKTLKKQNFKITYQGKKVPIKLIKVINEKKILVSTPNLIINENAIFKNKDLFKIELKNIRDHYNQLIYQTKEVPIYQYREFFVQEVFKNKKIDSNTTFVNKFKPLSKAKLTPFTNTNKYIINSPLMKVMKSVPK